MIDLDRIEANAKEDDTNRTFYRYTSVRSHEVLAMVAAIRAAMRVGRLEREDSGLDDALAPFTQTEQDSDPFDFPYPPRNIPTVELPDVDPARLHKPTNSGETT